MLTVVSDATFNDIVDSNMIITVTMTITVIVAVAATMIHMITSATNIRDYTCCYYYYS